MSKAVRPNLLNSNSQARWWACPTFLIATLLLYVVLWRTFHVTWSEISRFLGYEVLYALLPGLAVYRICARSPGSWLRQLAIGLPLGYALSSLTFMALSAFDARQLFFFYPLVILIIVVPFLIRSFRAKRTSDAKPRPRMAGIWVLLVLGLVIAVMIAAAYFQLTPLPTTSSFISYDPDLVWAAGNIAELQHHWPPEDPRVAGLPFRYHFFAYAHFAGIASITGITPSTVLFRLYILPFVLLFVISLYLLGYEATGKHAVGLLTVVLVVLLGELSFSTGPRFYNLLFDDLYRSPTFFFGLILFIPLIIEMRAWMIRENKGWLALLPITLLLIGSAGAKGSIVPIVLSGLFGVVGWSAVFRRRLQRRSLILISLTLVVFVPIFFWLYAGRGGMSSWLDPLHAVQSTPFYRDFYPTAVRYLQAFIGQTPATSLIATVLITGMVIFGYFGVRLVGLGYVIYEKRLRLSTGLIWLLMLFIASAVPSYLMGIKGVGELYFLFYGYVPLAVLASLGLYSLFQKRADNVLSEIVWAIVIILVFVSFSNTTLKTYRPVLNLLAKGRLQTNQAAGSLYQGLRWISANTPHDAVLIVNVPSNEKCFTYSAFAERRVLIEGWWTYTSEAYTHAQPFSERFDLVARIYGSGDPGVPLREAYEKYGARYLLVDTVNNSPQEFSSSLAQLVFANESLQVYEIVLSDE